MFRMRDFDRDGFPDLLIAGRDPDDRLMTRRGLGDGHFAELQLLTASGFIDWLELGDLDADGKDDIVAAWRGDVPRLVCYRGIGPGLTQFGVPNTLADPKHEVFRDTTLLHANDNWAANTTAAVNTAVGYLALANSNADGNTAVGFNALAANTGYTNTTCHCQRTCCG